MLTQLSTQWWYRTKFSRGERTYWSCTIFTCPATLNTRNHNITGLGQYSYNHPADQPNIASKEIMNFICGICQNEIRPMPSIYPEDITKLRDENGTMILKKLYRRYQHRTQRTQLYTEPDTSRHHNYQPQLLIYSQMESGPKPLLENASYSLMTTTTYHCLCSYRILCRSPYLTASTVMEPSKHVLQSSIRYTAFTY